MRMFHESASLPADPVSPLYESIPHMIFPLLPHDLSSPSAGAALRYCRRSLMAIDVRLCPGELYFLPAKLNGSAGALRPDRVMA